MTDKEINLKRLFFRMYGKFYSNEEIKNKTLFLRSHKSITLEECDEIIRLESILAGYDGTQSFDPMRETQDLYCKINSIPDLKFNRKNLHCLKYSMIIDYLRSINIACDFLEMDLNMLYEKGWIKIDDQSLLNDKKIIICNEEEYFFILEIMTKKEFGKIFELKFDFDPKKNDNFPVFVFTNGLEKNYTLFKNANIFFHNRREFLTMEKIKNSYY